MATLSAAGGTFSAVLPLSSRLGSVKGHLTLVVPAGAVSRPVVLSAAVAPRAGLPAATISRPAGAAIVLSATTTAGGVPSGDLHTFARPLTMALPYDPAGLTPAEQSRLVIAFLNPAGRTWTNLVTRVDPAAHTLTAAVSHLTIFQARLLTGPALRIAWPLAAHGQLSRPQGPQATIVGGRTGACPSVPALLKLIAANARRGLPNRFAPPYPAGCLWLPLQVSDPALAPQFAGAPVVVTAIYADRTRAVVTVRLDGQGHAIAVLAVRYRPRVTKRPPGHAAPAITPARAVATLHIAVADRHGVRQPPLQARFVVVAPSR
jgi:hypothetical protein